MVRLVETPGNLPQGALLNFGLCAQNPQGPWLNFGLCAKPFAKWCDLEYHANDFVCILNLYHAFFLAQWHTILNLYIAFILAVVIPHGPYLCSHFVTIVCTYLQGFVPNPLVVVVGATPPSGCAPLVLLSCDRCLTYLPQECVERHLQEMMQRRKRRIPV